MGGASCAAPVRDVRASAVGIADGGQRCGPPYQGTVYPYLARRIHALEAEANGHEAAIRAIVRAWRPDLLRLTGVGPIVAATVLTAWSHPAAAPRARPTARSTAASSATSPASSTAASNVNPQLLDGS
jgi:hypothetical protein